MSQRHQSRPILNDRSDDPAAAETAAPVRRLRLLTLLNVGVLACAAALLARAALWPVAPAQPAADSADDLKATALALEEHGLDAQAAETWQQYLDALPETPERADVLYRMGQLQMQARRFDLAAGSLVRAGLAAKDDKPLQEKIGPRLAECLRHCNRYGTVGRELSLRGTAGGQQAGSAQGQVVARIGGEKITESDLDRIIQHHVDEALASQGTAGDKSRRQALLQQLAGPAARAGILRELMQSEVFVRRAYELKLDQDGEMLLAREQAVDNLLIRRLFQKELNVAAPTDADLDAFFKAHQAEYRRPESLRVVAIRVADEPAAIALLQKIKSAEDFRKTAEDVQASAAAGTDAAFVRVLLRGQPDQVLGGSDPLFAMPEGQWTKQPLVQGDRRYLVLVDKKVPARVPALAEIKQSVLGDYLREKQREAVEKLFRQLAARYQVEILLQPPSSPIGALSGQADEMLSETGSASGKPDPAVKPEQATRPGEGPTEPATKPDNPLRKPGETPKPPIPGKGPQPGNQQTNEKRP
jgi:hypothetical protein